MGAGDFQLPEVTAPGSPAAGFESIFISNAATPRFSRKNSAGTTFISLENGVAWPAGTASTPPAQMTSGTNLTTAAAGAIEFDGKAFYQTAAASSRQVSVNEQFVALTAAYTLTSTTNSQKAFNATSTGALTIPANTSWFFECFLSVDTMSATSGNYGFDLLGAGTATISAQSWLLYGLDATTQSTAAAISGVASEAARTGDTFTAAVGTAAHSFAKGIFRVTTTGTIIPSVKLTTAAAAVVRAGSYFRAWCVGSDTVASVGNWS